jgi:hypothetical protein
MKSIIILLVTLVNFQVLGNDLTKLESQNLSQDLDNICGDTWCEGDFNWSVDNFTCSFEDKTCSVDLTLMEEFYFDDEYSITRDEFVTIEAFMSKYLDTDIESDSEYAAITWTQTCTMKGITSKDQVIDTSRRWSSYTQDIYERVTDCVTEIEEAYWEVQAKLPN